MVIVSLVRGAPRAARVPNAVGKMPIRLATTNECMVDQQVICAILETDMPIEIGSDSELVVERMHRHTWWHVAIECADRYTDAIEELLLGTATPAQLLALVRSVGPDGQTRTIDAASPNLVVLFNNCLRILGGRYEIDIDQVPILDSGVNLFKAIDIGMFDFPSDIDDDESHTMEGERFLFEEQNYPAIGAKVPNDDSSVEVGLSSG